MRGGEYAELYDWQVFYWRILDMKIPTKKRSLLCGSLEYLSMIGQLQHSAVNVLFMNWPWTFVLVSCPISMEAFFLSRDKKKEVNMSLYLTIQTLSSELWVIKYKLFIRILSLARNCKLLKKVVNCNSKKKFIFHNFGFPPQNSELNSAFLMPLN